MAEIILKSLFPSGVKIKVHIQNLQSFLSAPEVSTKACCWPGN